VFKIGEFSRLVRVSPRMLRHYEKCGLLCPASIDRYTGYRKYSAGQIPLLANIVALRDMGFSIDEISAILPNFDNPSYLDKVLRTKIAAVESSIETEQKKLEQLIEMSNRIRKERTIMVFDVIVQKLPPVRVLSLRGIIPHYKDEYMLWERLGKYIGENKIKETVSGSGYSTYFDEEYKESGPDVEIAVPVNVTGESKGEFIYKEYPEINEAATLRFSGPFDGGYDAACAKLAHWMEEHEYNFAGPLRGHVITSPHDESNPENWLTELQVPVARKGGAF